MPRVRKSPLQSATEFPVGTILNNWVVTKTSAGVRRWTPYLSTKLNGFRALTLDFLTENIGKKIRLYDREYGETWPRTIRDKDMYNYTFIPTGNVRKNWNKKSIENWLITRTPEIKRGELFRVEGVVNDGGISYLAIDSSNNQHVTGNLLSTETFVRVTT